MCTFDAVQDYELGFRQYDVLTAIAKAEEVRPPPKIKSWLKFCDANWTHDDGRRMDVHVGPLLVGRSDRRQDRALPL
jgi:hypothetical protein